MIDKTILDALIRTKLASVGTCKAVEPLPVAWRARVGSSCNWHVPGWVGEAQDVRVCLERISGYVHFLGAQFDIPEETAAER